VSLPCTAAHVERKNAAGLDRVIDSATFAGGVFTAVFRFISRIAVNVMVDFHYIWGCKSQTKKYLLDY